MFEIRSIDCHEQKTEICGAVLHALPDWFAVEASIAEYCLAVKALPFWAVFTPDNAIGFIALKQHNDCCAEICVMGILQNHHYKGLGRSLLEHCEAHCRSLGLKFLTVKTLDSSAYSPAYEKTRRFYRACGFCPLEVFPLYWDAENPCLLMAKHLP